MTSENRYSSGVIAMSPAHGWLGLVMVTLLALASGGVAGHFSNRWGRTHDLTAASRALDDVPTQFGDWSLVESRRLPPDVVTMLQCAGSLTRVYSNAATGDVVTVFVIVGPPGPTAVHTPDICYGGRDYGVLVPPEHFAVSEVGRKNAVLWGTTLQSSGVDATSLRVAYAWNSGAGWQAPSYPRFTFGAAPFLFKIQVAGALTRGNQQQETDPCRDFLRDFLPVLDRRILPSSATEG